MAIQAVIFDFDDTLAPEAASFEDALRNAAAVVTKKHNVSVDVLVQDVRSGARNYWRNSNLWAEGQLLGISSSEVFSVGFWEAPTMMDRLAALGEAMRPAVWRSALAVQGIHDEPLVSRLAERSLKEGTGPHRPYNGTEGVLANLSKRCPLGVLTNGDSAVQRRKVDRSGLWGHFRHVVVSGDFSAIAAKPDPVPFRHILKIFGVLPENAAMIGDNPVNDIQGAKRVGMSAIWVNRHGSRFSEPLLPDAEIADLSELPEALDSLNRD
jgi:putative hydrolase of the HAD superfamily